MSVELKQLQHLANILFMVFSATKTDSVYDNNTRWLGVAKAVKIIEIEARIEELGENGDYNDIEVKNRMKELMRQLKTLKGT